MANPVNPPRGMRDFLPADKARREHALGIIKGVYRAHGFDEIETPVVEDYARLHAGLGGDNEKLSFSILKRGITSDALAAAAEAGNAEQLADLGLRFDLTVPLTRFYASHRSELPPVFRALQIAPVWRAERPQKGRYRQFLQADIDIIGEAGLLAEIELITATSQALASLGLEGCVIRVNDRRVLFGLLAHCGFVDAVNPSLTQGLQERILITIDKIDKIGVDGVLKELRNPMTLLGVFNADFDLDGAVTKLGEALAACEPMLLGDGIPLADTRDIFETLVSGISKNENAAAGLTSLTELGEALEGALPDGVDVCFDPTLVRGMGYYTGTIFEIAHPGSGSSVGGGGRYDGMVGRFLGQDVPAVGFSIGFERVVDLIELPGNDGPDAVALIFDKDAAPADLAALKRDLVARGHRVRLERRQKNMKALLDRVASEGFTSFANVATGVRDADAIELRPLSS